MKQINLNNAIELIKSTKGKVFTAIFTKKNGTSRKINCRLGVSKGVNGTGLAYSPKDYDLLTVFDMKEKGFRMINLPTLTALQVNGEFYVVSE